MVNWHLYPNEDPPHNGQYAVTIAYRDSRQVEYWYWEDGIWYMDLFNDVIYESDIVGRLVAWTEEIRPYEGEINDVAQVS